MIVLQTQTCKGNQSPAAASLSFTQREIMVFLLTSLQAGKKIRLRWDLLFFTLTLIVSNLALASGDSLGRISRG